MCDRNLCNYGAYVVYHPERDIVGEVCLDCYNKLSSEYGENKIINGKCPICNNYTDIINFIRVEIESKWICNSCYHEHYWMCACCGHTYRRADSIPMIYTHEDYPEDAPNRNASLCNGCYDNYTRRFLIHDYNYVPNSIKFYNDKLESRNLLYFGIELEIESCGNDKYELANSLPDFVYAKADGSLYDGFEIVSHPTSYRWLMSNKEAWNEILKIRYKGWRSYQTKTCGMHIHLSKIAFGNYHLYKFMRLFYDNPKFITKISQRISNTNLNRWASISDSERHIKNKAKEKRTYDYEERYTAVNIGREHTVEIRIFRGTLFPESFWKNVMFVKAAFEYSYKGKVNDMTEIGFRHYIKTNKNEFPELYRFLYSEQYVGVNLSEGC